MPMVWHETVGKKCNVAARDRRSEEVFKRGVITRILKKDAASCAAIHDMEHNAGRRSAWSSRHDTHALGNVGAELPRSCVLQK